MNSQNPDHRTPMLNTQYYDDTKLQRKTKFLVSGLFLCFVISVASLGISIMILMKNQDLPDLVEYVKKAPQSQKIKNDLDVANSMITALQSEIVKLKILLDKHSTQLQSLSAAKEIKFHLDKLQAPAEKLDDHSSHSHIGQIDSDLLEKNMEDLFFSHEGSGGLEDTSYESDDYFDELGSGSSWKCDVFATPLCPEGHQVCWTDERCPVPFCCNSEVAY